MGWEVKKYENIGRVEVRITHTTHTPHTHIHTHTHKRTHSREMKTLLLRKQKINSIVRF